MMKFAFLFCAVVANALPSSTIDIPSNVDSVVHNVEGQISIASKEDVYGIQFKHANCELEKHSENPLDFHKSKTVALAFSQVGKAIPKSTVLTPVAQAKGSCQKISDVVIATKGGRKLSVKIEQ